MWRRILDSPWLYFGGAGVLVLAAVLSQVEIRLPVRPVGTIDQLQTLRDRDDLSVVFVLIDTLRADRLHAYGYERETSTYMDWLASTGIRFDRCVSQSTWTKSSMASLWTGTYPAVNGVMRWPHSLPEAVDMPAEILRAAGFTTAGVYRNGWVAPNFGFGQGFEIYYRPMPGREPERFQRRTPSSHPLHGTDEEVTENAIEFLQGHGHERFLLYLHYMDIHQYAYDQESALFGTSYSDVYDNSIAWVDRNIGVLISNLERLKLSDRTLVVIAADHGEGFQEHGMEGHGKSLYREVVEVPLIMALPFQLEPGVVVNSVVQNVDVWPTIMDLLGLPPLAGAQGISLVPLIEAAARGDEAGFRRPAFGHMDRVWGSTKRRPDEILAVTTDTHRLIRRLSDDERGPRLQLFDHRSDPLEQRNVVEEQPEVAEQLEALGQSYLESDGAAWGAPDEVELEEMRLEHLRALGYIIQ